MATLQTGFLDDEAARIRAAGLHRRLRIFDGPPGPRVLLEGREVVLLASNSYLGLATHPDVLRAGEEAARAYGSGSGGSRLISGTTRAHRDLEEALACWKGGEEAVLFGTGYQANVGAITALAGPGDLVLSDELNHASIIDGCRLSRASVQVYRHRDTTHAAQILERERAAHRRCLVVTDGVFSMDGDLAPLPRLCDLADRHDALLMVDDAHAVGVLGRTGSGTAEHLGVLGRVPVQMGTLSKALASEGGFIVGSAVLCDVLRNTARPFIFSTAPAPASVASAGAALRIVRTDPDRRARLAGNGAAFRQGLRAAGMRVPQGETPIVPLLIGGSAPALRFQEALEEDDVFAPAIRPPTVPEGTCRIRASLMATHTARDIDEAVGAFAKAWRAGPGVAAYTEGGAGGTGPSAPASS